MHRYQSSVHEFQSAQRNFDKELASLYKVGKMTKRLGEILWVDDKLRANFNTQSFCPYLVKL